MPCDWAHTESFFIGGEREWNKGSEETGLESGRREKRREKERENQREKDGQRERDGKAYLLKGNAVNVYRRCS